MKLAFGVARLAPVVGERRGRLCDTVTGRLLDEAGDGRVPFPSHSLRKRRVCDLANEHVLEREFLVSLHAGGRLAANQVALLERFERLGDATRVAAQVLEGPRPEDLADNGGIEDHRALLG
jgi:hypothetical protein